MISFSSSFDILSNFKPKDEKQLYQMYMVVFYIFLSSELCASLKMPSQNLADYKVGRNISIVNSLYQTILFIIKNKKNVSGCEYKINQLIKSIRDIVNTISEDCFVNFSEDLDIDLVDSQLFADIESRLMDFSTSHKAHSDFESILYKTLYGANAFSVGCVQAMIEFFNSFSHLVVCCKKDALRDERQDNLNKAKAHLYRGTLDNYKSIIKNAFLYVGDNMLKCGDRINNNDDNISSVRRLEILSLGCDLGSISRHELIDNYRTMSKIAIESMGVFKKTGKPILTRLQKSFIYDVLNIFSLDNFTIGCFVNSVKKWNIGSESLIAERLAYWITIFIISYKHCNLCCDFSSIMVDHNKYPFYENFIKELRSGKSVDYDILRSRLKSDGVVVEKQ
mgnify:CR=1 FL=1